MSVSIAINARPRPTAIPARATSSRSRYARDAPTGADPLSAGPICAILTVAGYSINDTVVIYDRVREAMRKHRTMPFSELINLALNETLSRTILTVSTVALAVLSLLFLGGEVLKGFSIAMLWGIVIGTYSSLFIAAPIIYYIQPSRRSIARESAGADVEPARPPAGPPSRPRGAKS